MSDAGIDPGQNARPTNDTALLRVGDARFSERLQSYLDLRSALRERIADIDYVDLRFDPRVYVRPQGRMRAAGAAPGQTRLRESASAGQARTGGARPLPGRSGG